MNRTQQTEEFLKQSAYRLSLNTPRIEKCLKELSEAEVWQRPNSTTNSVANLILHLCGNIRQYIISGLGGKEDLRERDKEFSATAGYNKQQLLEKLSATVSEAIEVLQNLQEEDLLNVRSVQGSDHTGTGIIIHVVEHYSYHTGQIAFWTKLLKERDLGFYAGLDLNKKNKIA